MQGRLESFLTHYGAELLRVLGSGKDGSVYESTRATAIKVFRRRELFLREFQVYQRLDKWSVLTVLGHQVPQLICADDTLCVLEMSIVKPPFVLDFAGAWLDHPPDFPSDVMDEWMDSRREIFEHRWPQVLAILRAFRRYGVHLTDVHPGNIAFAADVAD